MRGCASEVARRLKGIVEAGSRTISALEQSGILPEDTIYFSETLPCTKTASAAERLERLAHRTAWVDAAAKATSDCDIVFLDPDNGIASPERTPNTEDAPKYVYGEDLRKFVAPDRTVVIYHHCGRHLPVEAQVDTVARWLADGARLRERPIALRFRRGSSRIFFVLPARNHRDRIGTRLDGFLKLPWEHAFERQMG